MENTRDIIIVTGPLATGKTFTINYLRNWAHTHNIPYEENSISDAQTVIKNMEKDDLRGGFYHYHPWCKHNLEGHTHSNGEPEIPMTFYGNKIVDEMYMELFQRLNNLPYQGKYWFVEFAGGDNTNRKSTLEYQINYSFARLGKMIEKNAFPSDWLKRVYAVIHPEANFQLRVSLNKLKTNIDKQSIKNGTVSASNVMPSMQVTGKDNFSQIQKVFERSGVRNIYTLKNTGDTHYEQLLDQTAQKLFTQYIPKAMRRQEDRDIILVVGRNGSGKKTTIDTLYKEAEKYHISYNALYISDYDSYLFSVHDDDLRGGLNHYHFEAEELRKSNQHSSPFIITDNNLITTSLGNFFNKISQLPHTGSFWFVDWGGGKNINSSFSPASQVDVSYETAARFFKKGIYSHDWFKRVYAIIHPVVSENMRSNFNETESIVRLEKRKKSVVAPMYRSSELLNMYGQDDFFEISHFFHEVNVPYIFHCEADTQDNFKKNIKSVSELVMGSVTNSYS